MTNEAEPELSIAQVRQVAALCHIALTDEEAEQLRGEMAKLLGEVSVLQRIDTSGVEPTGHAVDGYMRGGVGGYQIHTVMRGDVPRPPLEREDVLANAPHREGPYFRVRAVMDES